MKRKKISSSDIEKITNQIDSSIDKLEELYEEKKMTDNAREHYEQWYYKTFGIKLK
jgi:sugar-specific transcriptional regulator TrmB